MDAEYLEDILSLGESSNSRMASDTELDKSRDRRIIDNIVSYVHTYMSACIYMCFPVEERNIDDRV